MKPSGYVSLGWDAQPHREWVDDGGEYWLLPGDDPIRDSAGWPLDTNMMRLPPDYERPDYEKSGVRSRKSPILAVLARFFQRS